MTRTLIALACAVTPLFGQFTDLAPTDDGAQLYFATRLRLKSETELRLPGTAAIYRFSEGRVQRFTNPPVQSFATEVHNNPQLSGGGTIVSYTRTVPCTGGSSCIGRPTVHFSDVLGLSSERVILAGRAQISRNGRYLLNVARQATFPIPTQPVVARELRDLATGTVTRFDVWPLSDRQAVTSDGRVLGSDLEMDSMLRLWSRQEIRQVPTVGRPLTAIINDTGRVVVYEIGSESTRELHALDLNSGRDNTIARGSTLSFQPSISNDGATILFVEGPTILVSSADGSQRRALPVDEGVTSAVLAGFGRYAFATTKLGRLLKIDVHTAATTEMIGPTPVYYLGSTALIPGSVLPIRGTALSAKTAAATPPLPGALAGVQVLVNGEPMPMLSVSPEEVWFQMPFELAGTSGQLVLRLNDASLFEGGARSTAVSRRAPYFFSDDGLIAAHQDFGGLVTRASPARGGEIVHLYAVGLGLVDPPVATGVPAPASPLSRLRDPFECSAGSRDPLEVLFAGLAPGSIGIYQIDIRMPNALPGGTLFIACGFPDNPLHRHGGYLYTRQ